MLSWKNFLISFIYFLIHSAMTFLTLVRLFLWENLCKSGWVFHIWKIHRLNMLQNRQYCDNIRQYFDAVLFFSARFEEYWWGCGVECFLIFGLLKEGWNRSFHPLFILYTSSIISSSEKTLQNNIWWLMSLKMFFNELT